MLIRYSVENFRSFKTLETFNMVPGSSKHFNERLYNKDNIKLLRFSAIYGANAAGKSNLIASMKYAKVLIIEGIESLSVTDYYRLDSLYKEKETRFEFEIKIGNKFYAYGISYLISGKEIKGEWLYDITDSKNEIMMFERDDNKIKTSLNIKDAQEKIRFNVYKNDVEGSTCDLLLKEIGTKKLSSHSQLYVIKEIYNWFKFNLRIFKPDEPIGSLDFFSDDIKRDQLGKLLNDLDTGILGISFINVEADELARNLPKKTINKLILDLKEAKMQENNKSKSITVRVSNQYYKIILNDDKVEIKKYVFAHSNDNIEALFDLIDESDGTQRIIDLLNLVLAPEEENIYIIDELDRSLHPNLVKKFVELFLELGSNKDSQLIVSTHASVLMDLNLLRRDELWFVERDKNCISKLFSLEDFKERYDRRVEKSYLEGRYGAVPLFGTFDRLNLEE
ncbi:AAA family ATPase [Abyssisolibacter fermentans]|uniref:AAA family ATPase n=1 Tax=Abyssisolibacter fermentans TaxID=1766203 RepID=UPI00082FBF5D|nr:AAA family ATPase [Abyssisolibacter fermentans]